ncbi:MAG: AmmeMemoRadiSam system protein B [bacterium]
MEIKALRYVDIKQISEDLFIVSDPFCIAEDFVVNRITLLIMFLLDGSRTFDQIRKEIVHKTGVYIKDEELKEIVSFFEQNGLFLNDSFEKIRKQRVEDIRKKGYLDFYFADRNIPSNPLDAISFLRLDKIKQKGQYLAAIIPHLEIRLALPAYQVGYENLDRESFQRVFILGVSHYFHQGLISVFPYDFHTPFGIIETDRQVVRAISREFKIDIFENLLSYKKEHSIGFQLPFIKYLFNNPKVVGILVSYTEDLEYAKKYLSDVASFISANYPDSVFISSVDFSHVGRKFGDKKLIDPEEIDRKYISFLDNIDPEGSIEYLKNIKNETRIDGVMTNYLFLKIIKFSNFTKSKVLIYEKYFEKETNSMVSYSTIVFGK